MPEINSLERAANQVQLTATILAAGMGQRLGGRAKATLQINGISLLERQISALQSVGIASISVVVGPYRDQLMPLISKCGAVAVTHHHASASLVDSQRLALDAQLSAPVLQADKDLLLVLAGLPLLQARDIMPLASAWHQRASSVHALLPVVNEVRGHPLFLSSYAIKKIAYLNRGVGIREWLQKNPELVCKWVTNNHSYITDVDTPEDVLNLQALLYPMPVCWPS